MRLLIIASDSSGGVTLASPRVFADAGEATRELARFIAERAVDVSASFYTVDMDAALPVIILQQPAAEPTAPSEPVEEPFASEVLAEASAEEDPVEPVETEEASFVPIVVADETPATEDEPAEEASAQPEAAAGAQWPWDLPVIPDEGSADDVAAAIAEDTEETSETPESVPMPAVEEPEPAVEEAQPAPYADFTFEVPGAEPAADVADLPAEIAEIEAEPAAVDFGGYAPEPVVEPVAEEAVATDLVADEPIADVAAVAEDAAPVAEAEPALALDDDLAVVVEPQSVVDAEAAQTAEASSELVYEPGALNMSEYTCNDCVYVNTCPNRDQKRPAECGSFQWKSA